MILSLKIDNLLVFNDEVEFSMRADMRYKRLSANVASSGNTNALKSAVILGPNNSGKTCFVRVLSMLKALILGQSKGLTGNLFSKKPVSSVSVVFSENDKEYLLEIRYDIKKSEYVYERFAVVDYNEYGKPKNTDLMMRDNKNKKYYAQDEELAAALKIAAKNAMVIHSLDTDEFPHLEAIREILIKFANNIDIVDMNNIPLNKTIGILKKSGNMSRKIVDFVRNADLSLDDYLYLTDDQIQIKLNNINPDEAEPQEKVLNSSAPLMEMLHLASVYKGITVPSVLYDSTGTKKIAALAGYVIDALENGRILVVDELDNSLHFKLTRAIIALFNNELNTCAQLIATVHDVSLLDCKTLFRKEQIWFATKDKENAYLYSLAEFTAKKDGVRDTSDIFEKYRKGLLGALPEPDLFSSLPEVSGNV